MTNSRHELLNSELRLVDERVAAEFLGYSVRALQNWRHRGGGPLFVKVSSRSIRYRVCDLKAWASEQLTDRLAR